MPVRKFRDVSEMEDIWYKPGSPELYSATARVWALAEQICPLQFPRGVHKYRSIEDANADRDRWEEANFRAFHARRGTPLP